MKIQIENRQSLYKIDKRKIRGTVSGIFKILNCTNKEISIVLTDDETIKRMNHQYLGRNKPTNVISFSMQEGEFAHLAENILGDVVISADTAAREAAESGVDGYQRLIFLLLHGILHLAGYDHERSGEEEAKRMMLKEAKLWKILQEEGFTTLHKS